MKEHRFVSVENSEVFTLPMPVDVSPGHLYLFIFGVSEMFSKFSLNLQSGRYMFSSKYPLAILGFSCSWFHQMPYCFYFVLSLLKPIGLVSLPTWISGSMGITLSPTFVVNIIHGLLI